MAMAQQRMQQNASGGGGPSGMPDGSARVGVQGGGTMVSENQLHQGAQSAGSIGSHDGSGSQVQEPERAGTGEGQNDQSVHPNASNNEGQIALRRNGAMGLVASAASAFDAAKDIMETLRSKHTNLASELEVIYLVDS